MWITCETLVKKFWDFIYWAKHTWLKLGFSEFVVLAVNLVTTVTSNEFVSFCFLKNFGKNE